MKDCSDNALLTGGTTDTVPRGYSFGEELQQVRHAVQSELGRCLAVS